MIYYLVISGSTAFIIKKFTNVLKIYHAYDNFYMIKVNKLTKMQRANLNEVGWTFYSAGEKN